LLEVCYDALTLNTAEQLLFNFVGLKKAKRDERTAAAKLIQFHWRYQRSIAKIMEQERAETLKARVLDQTHYARRISQLKNLSLLAEQQGDLEDEALEAGNREPLLQMAITDGSSVEFDRSSDMGSREREVALRYGRFWEEDAASYKVKTEGLRKELRTTHRDRLELEPPGSSCKKELGIDAVIRRAIFATTQDVIHSHVEESLSRLLEQKQIDF